MELLLYFLAGFTLTNGIPHLVKGITGEKHMTPFKRVSPALLNIVWAYANFIIGIWILSYLGASVDNLIMMDGRSLSFWLGSFLLALSAAKLFSNPNARLPWHKD